MWQRKPWRRIRKWLAQETEVEVFLMIGKFLTAPPLALSFLIPSWILPPLFPLTFSVFFCVLSQNASKLKENEKKRIRERSWRAESDSSSSNIPLCGRYYWWKCKLDFQIYYPVCFANRGEQEAKARKEAKDSPGTSHFASPARQPPS